MVSSPSLFGWVRSGLMPKPVCRLLHASRINGVFKHGGYQVAATRIHAMPRRLSAALSRTPVAGGGAFESIEPRRRRLLPQSEQPAPSPPPPPTRAAGRPEAASASHTVERMPNRADAPVLHPTRRGSRAKATAAIRDSDPDRLVHELIVDRHAASGASAAASLLRGWEHYHVLSHRHLADPPGTYPVTADSIIRVGSLFKKAGYRSFPNYLSAAKARHIEGPPAAE